MTMCWSPLGLAAALPAGFALAAALPAGVALAGVLVAGFALAAGLLDAGAPAEPPQPARNKIAIRDDRTLGRITA